jgi:chromosome segregation ATPase
MSHITEGDNLQSVEILQEQVTNQKQQINVKDEQIERLQSALDQSQQLQALTESRYQAKHQQLAEMRSRSVLQRLRAVFVADYHCQSATHRNPT